MPTESTEEVKPTESEIMKVQREHYEKMLADKDKIIKDLIEGKKAKKKGESIIEDEDEEVEDEDKEVETKKQDAEAEERRKRRFEYYKKHIY